MTLFRDSKVQWGGMDVGGIRISHMSDISGVATLPLTVTKGKKAPFVVKPLSASAPASTEPAQSVEDRVARFLANLKTKLATCETREQVEAVAVSKQVKATLDRAPIGVRTQINGIVAAALERFPVVVDAAEIDEEVPF
jgi:hypothetical protein